MQSLENLTDETKDLKEQLTKEFREYRKDVDIKFDRASKKFNDFEIQMTVDITTLKTKAAIWGAIFGALLGALVSTIIDILVQNKLTH